MQINRGGVLQRFVLLVRRGDDVRMAMADADGDDAAEAVEIAFAGFVPDILHLALHDHDRLLVVEKDAGVQELLAQGEHFLGGRAGVGLRLMVRTAADGMDFMFINSGS